MVVPPLDDNDVTISQSASLFTLSFFHPDKSAAATEIYCMVIRINNKFDGMLWWIFITLEAKFSGFISMDVSPQRETNLCANNRTEVNIEERVVTEPENRMLLN